MFTLPMHEIDLHRLDLNLLVALHVLIEERSVSRAAERLHLSQSATSHALGRLRDYFGDPLLVRTARGMEPTPRALALAPPLDKALGELAGVARRSAFEPPAASGIFRMTITVTASVVLVPRLVERLAALAPDVHLECRHWSADTLPQLDSGLVDLALGARGHGDLGRFRVEPLMVDDYACVVRRGHPVVGGGLSRAAYEAWPHLLIELTDVQTAGVNRVIEGHGIRRRARLTTQHALSAHLVVARSDMILTVPRSLANLYAEVADVVVLDPPIDLGDFPLFMVWHERRTADPMHAWVRGLVLELSRPEG